MEAREDGALPADNGAGGFAAGHKRLGIDHGPTPQERRPDQSLVLVNQCSLCGPGQQRRSLQLLKEAFGLGERVRDSYAITA